MSMIDSFFAGKGFKAAKCKTLLKLTIPRIKLLRNRKEIQIKQMRREIAKLLETGQEATARIRVEHIIREEKMMAAHEIVELYSELIAVRLPIIEVQRECPLDLKEAISSVCFAAPRCADLPELLQVQMLFAGKYGKEFIAAATELRPECGVSRQLIELLSVRAPAPEVKLKLLKEIAEEHELDWDPAASETELLKPHEDLLNGSSQFVSGPNLPLPAEKPDESLRSTSEQGLNEESDSDEYFDGLDFPEVPKASLRPGFGVVPGPEMLPFPDSAISGLDDYESETPPAAKDNPSHETSNGVEKILQEISGTKEPELSKDAEKQFLPFISPPSLSSASFPMRQTSHPSYLGSKSEYDVDLQDVLAAAQAAAESAECAAAAARSAANLVQVKISELVKKKNEEAFNGSNENPFSGVHKQESQLPSSLSRSKILVDFDLQDVLAAAQVAAESGECAAASARSAASLAQVRIGKFVGKTNEEAFNGSSDSDVPSKQDLSHLNNYVDTLNSPTQETLNFSSYDDSKVDFESSPSGNNVFGADISHPLYDDSKGEFESSSSPSHDIFGGDSGHHQPQRLPSLDDEVFNSYPNLFTSSHGSYDISRSSSFADTSRITGGH